MKIRLYESPGSVTAELPIMLDDGRKLMIRSTATLADVAREMGLDPRAIAAGDVIVGWNPFKAIGKVVKKIAKSKVIRKVVKVAKDVIKNPITTAALGAVSGGTLLAPMAAANAAVRLTEAAIKAGKKGAKAAKVLRAAVKASDKHEAKRAKVIKLRDGLKKRGLLNPQTLAKLQLKAARRKVVIAKARKEALRRLGEKARGGSPAAARAIRAQRTADFLVNVHLV